MPSRVDSHDDGYISPSGNSDSSPSKPVGCEYDDRATERLIARDTKRFKNEYFIEKVILNSANGIIYQGELTWNIPLFTVNRIAKTWRARNLCQTSAQSKNRQLGRPWRSQNSERVQVAFDGQRDWWRCQGIIFQNLTNVDLMTFELYFQVIEFFERKTR